MELDHESNERATDLLDPVVRDAIVHITARQFSTKRLIEEVCSTANGAEAYQQALAIAEEAGADATMARHIVHGQIIPFILRGSGLVRFAGFIHGMPSEDDGYGVPSRWRRL